MAASPPPPPPARCTLISTIVEALQNASAASPAHETLGRTGIVLAHCRADIGWLVRSIGSLQARGIEARVSDVHVYSKCGKAATRPSALPAAVNFWVTLLSNVGRNDHAFAHHIARHYRDLPRTIFFLKDTHAAYPNRHFHSLRLPVDDMAIALQSEGFACGRAIDAKTQPGATVYHSTATLALFQLETYAHGDPQVESFRSAAKTRPLGTWLQHVFSNGGDGGTPLTNRHVVPVCYGGVFAASAERIRRTPQRVWQRLRDALARGDNIEEGHYMERSWAALLTPPLPAAAEEALLCHVRQHHRDPYNSYAGIISQSLDPGPASSHASRHTACREACGANGKRSACRACLTEQASVEQTAAEVSSASTRFL